MGISKRSKICRIFEAFSLVTSNFVIEDTDNTDLYQDTRFILTFVQLNAINTETTDFEICVSGGRVLANVGNSFLSDVSRCVQNWEESG